MNAPLRQSRVEQQRLAATEIAVTLVPIASLFAFLIAFGANRNDLAVLASAVFGLQVIMALVLTRQDIHGLWRGLRMPAALYATAGISCAWALTPLSPEGPHPVWTYVAAMPAIALDRSEVIIGLVKLAGLACCFIVGLLICRSERQARLFLRGLLVGGGLYGLWSLVAHAVTPDSVLGVPNEMHGGRLTGSLFSANAAGTLFGMLLVLAVALFLAEVQRGSVRVTSLAWRSLLPAIAAAIFAVCLALSTSRGAFGATLCGLIVLMIWTRFARNWRADTARNIFVSIGYLALAGVLLVAGNVAVERYATALQDWEAQRSVIYATHWSAFLSSPWFGYGLGSFDAINKLLMTSENYAQLWNVRAAHNVYLQWLEEAGVAGAVPMFMAIGSLLFGIARGAVRRHSNRSKLVLRGIVGASIVVLVHGWSDFGLQVPAIAALWALLLGCGTAIAFSSRESDAIGVVDRSLSRRMPVIIGASVGFASIVAGSVIFAELAFTSSPTLVPLSTVYARRAAELEMRGANASVSVAQAQQFADQELAQDPASVAGWLRLAYIEWARRGAIGEGVSALIDRSFLVGPLDPDVFEWRTRFALEHWDRVNGAVRDDVLAALRASWSVWPQKVWLEKLGPTIDNPSGRLALALAITDLKAREAVAQRSDLSTSRPETQ